MGEFLKRLFCGERASPTLRELIEADLAADHDDTLTPFSDIERLRRVKQDMARDALARLSYSDLLDVIEAHIEARFIGDPIALQATAKRLNNIAVNERCRRVNDALLGVRTNDA